MLFSGVRYAISPSLPSQRQYELSKLLDANGATVVEFADASHVVSNTLQFEGRESLAEDCRIITDVWVDRSIVQGKLQDTKYFSADPIMIFSGVVACVADLEPCDVEVIAAGINALGGLFREGYTVDCTHVLAARPGSDKYNTAMHFADATRVKVVLPHWFDDCFKLLMRLPEDQYLWPDPPLLRTNYALSKARLAPPTKALVKAAVLEEEPAEKIAALGRSENNIWHGRRILLSSTLNLANGRREAVEASVQRAGGVIVVLSGDEAVDVEDADVYVTLHRLGTAFVKAIRANKLVGTLSWLFNVHKSGIVTSPLDQLLHFPSPRPPLPGFKEHKITATNYEGDARRYLKKLIELMGGEFTPQMTAQNTVVVAAYIEGAKSTKAREWNIPIVNHTWLEDCFATWSLVTPAQEKYVSFPPGVNFGDLVAKRCVAPLSEEELDEIDRTSLEAEALTKVAVAAAESRKEDVDSQVERPAKGSSRTRNVQNRSPSNKAQTGRSQSGSQVTPLKPAAARLNVQREVKRHEGEEEEEEEEENEKEDSQPRRGKGMPKKRRRESNDESEAEIQTRRGRGRGHISPSKGTARSRARSDIESEDEVEDAIRRPTKATRTAAKPSPMKHDADAKTKGAHVDDDSEDESPRRIGKLRKSDSRNARTSKETVSSALPSKTTKGKSKSVLELMDDDEFASSSDDGLSPIKTSKNPAGQKSSSKTKQAKVPKSRATEFEEEEEEDEEEEAPRLRHSRKNAAGSSKRAASPQQEPRTPVRKQHSVPGPTPGKAVFVEIPSPQKSSSQLSRTHSVTAGADRDAEHSTSKRGRPTVHMTHANERENDSPPSSAGTPAESPSRSSRFSENAVRRSSQPTPIMSPAALQLLRTPSKRQAASKASARLHENALDIIKFEKEKRSGRFRGAWEDGMEKTKGRTEVKQEDNKKRRSSAVHDESDAEESNAKNKKRKSDDVESDKKSGVAGKKSRKPRVSTSSDEAEEAHVSEQGSDEDVLDGSDIRLLTTQVTLSDQILKGLLKLDVKMAAKPTECNLLLANSIGRTEKFLCAMATARAIVTESWAIDSVKAKRILPPHNYFLKDVEGEKKHNFRLADALRRAQSSEKKLLEGHTFYFTKGLHRSEKLPTYKNVVHSAGGKVVLVNPTVRILKGHEDRHVLTVEGDSSITDPLKEEGFHVYLPEFILVGILTQRMDWDNTPHQLHRN